MEIEEPLKKKNKEKKLYGMVGTFFNSTP